MIFTEEDIPILDYILKTLIDDNNFFDRDTLKRGGFNNNPSETDWRYYVDILESYNCIIPAGNNKLGWYNGRMGTYAKRILDEGGFRAIYNAKLKLQKEKEEKEKLEKSNLKWQTFGVKGSLLISLIALIISIIALFKR